MEQDFVIKNGTLIGCPTDMNEIVVPEGVRRMSKDALYDLSCAEALHLPSTFERLPRMFPIYTPRLKTLTVAEDNPHFTVVDNVLFSKDMRSMLFYPRQKEDESYVVPEGIEKIGADCIGNNFHIRKLKLPETLKVIGDHSIFFLINLRSIHIPKRVRRIEKDFLWACHNIKSITVDPENKFYFADDGILLSKDGKALVRYMETKKGESYDIPYGIEVIADGAFCCARRLKCVTIPDSVKTLGSAFWNSNIREISIPDSVAEIPEGCFADCNRLEKVRLPKYLTRLEGYVFDGCCRLKEINIPESVTFFGPNALLGVSLKHIKVPKGTKSLGWNAFANIYGLRSVELPSTLESFEGPALWMTGIDTVILPDGFKSLGHASFAGSNLKHIKIPCGVTVIPKECFNNCKKLTQAELSPNIVRVESEAFAYCCNLRELTFTERCKFIAPDAFEGCPELTICAPKGSYAYRYAKRHGILVKGV